MQLIDKICKENNYQSKNWNKEVAYRYIIRIDDKIIEASCFYHYLDSNFVKVAIELPSSFGCSIKCKHCASGDISNTKQLVSSEIIEILEYIYFDQKVEMQTKCLVTYSGIGEGALNRYEIEKSIIEISKRYSNIYFTLTTIGCDLSYISFIDNLSSSINSHYLQITYLHYDVNSFNEIVRAKINYSFEDLLRAIENIKYIRPRLNFVMIKDFNDSLEHWNVFISKIESIKKKIVVRITSLNNTNQSKRFNLEPVDNKTLLDFSCLLMANEIHCYCYFADNNDNFNCGQLIYNYISQHPTRNNPNKDTETF